MHLGIDGNEANILKRVGSNIYAHEMLAWFERLDKKNQFTVYLKKNPVSSLPQDRNLWQYRVLKPEIIWTRWRLPLDLYFGPNKLNVFFTPGHYAPKFCPVPLAISIMDLSFLHFPEMFRKADLYKLKNWTGQAVSKANHIFTISEFSKNDIIQNYNVPGGKITVTYPGFNTRLYSKPITKKDINKIKEKYDINGDYILYLGTLQPRKNLIRLIKAFANLDSNNIQLVISGKKGWHYREIFHQAEKLGIKERVIITDFIVEENKPALIKGALCLTLVSLYEGFGIPVLEAMAVGTPTLVSDNSSLAEVVGELGVLTDPMSVKSITRGLTRVIHYNEAMRKELSMKSINRAQQFTWEKAARKTLEVLYEIAI